MNPFQLPPLLSSSNPSTSNPSQPQQPSNLSSPSISSTPSSSTKGKPVIMSGQKGRPKISPAYKSSYISKKKRLPNKGDKGKSYKKKSSYIAKIISLLIKYSSPNKGKSSISNKNSAYLPNSQNKGYKEDNGKFSYKKKSNEGLSDENNPHKPVSTIAGRDSFPILGDFNVPVRSNAHPVLGSEGLKVTSNPLLKENPLKPSNLSPISFGEMMGNM